MPGHPRRHFEVVIVQERQAHTWPNGVTTPAHEAMPGNEQWGTAGWSPFDLPAAKTLFAKLISKDATQPA